MKSLFQDLAEANRYINREWLEVLAPLSLKELDRPQGAFFGTIFGTFNHILLGDRVWLGRLGGQPFPSGKLSDRLCATVEEFRKERAKTDEALIALVEGEQNFERVIQYSNNQGNPDSQRLHQILLHLFAHQNHHRGHISQMCHERSIPIPDGGYIGFYRAGRGRN